jgi:hypothetical protein
MDAKLRDQLLETYDLDPAVFDRLVADLWSLTRATPEEWIQRRHRQLQAQGRQNSEIFGIIERELGEGRFAAPPFSLRQIRRVIYG